MTTRDVLLQVLPRLGYKLLDAFRAVVANDATASQSSIGSDLTQTLSCDDFVRAVVSISPEVHLAVQLSGSKASLPFGKLLKDELAKIFEELAKSKDDAAADASEDAGSHRVPVGSAIARMRTLRKAEDPAPGSMGAQGVAAMALVPPKLALPPKLTRLNILLHAQASTATWVLGMWEEEGHLPGGVVTRDVFRKLLPALHISATRAETDALYDSLCDPSAQSRQGDAGIPISALLARVKDPAMGKVASDLGSGRVRVKSAGGEGAKEEGTVGDASALEGGEGGNATGKGAKVGKAGKGSKTQRRAPAATGKPEYVERVIESLGAAYFLPPTEAAPSGAPLRIYANVHAPPRPSPRVLTPAPAEPSTRSAVDLSEGESPRARKLLHTKGRDKGKASGQGVQDLGYIASVPLASVKPVHVAAHEGHTAAASGLHRTSSMTPKLPAISPRHASPRQTSHLARQVGPPSSLATAAPLPPTADASPRPPQGVVDPPISPRKRHAFLEGRHKPKLPPPPREIRYATGVAVHIPPQFTAELAVAKDVMQQQEEMARALARIKELEEELKRTESLASLASLKQSE